MRVKSGPSALDETTQPPSASGPATAASISSIMRGATVSRPSVDSSRKAAAMAVESKAAVREIDRPWRMSPNMRSEKTPHHPHAGDATHHHQEGRQLPRLWNLPFLAGLLSRRADGDSVFSRSLSSAMRPDSLYGADYRWRQGRRRPGKKGNTR